MTDEVDRQHPFISFNFNTSQLLPDIWLMLGEAMSKCQHLAGMPLKPAAAENLSAIYLARGVHATTAIEGNTLSTDEVERIVRTGTAAVVESREYLQREVQNVLAAIRAIDDALKDGKRLPIYPDRLCRLNAQILEGIPDKPEVVPGQLRQHNVAAGTYLAPEWHLVPELLRRFTNWLLHRLDPPVRKRQRATRPTHRGSDPLRVRRRADRRDELAFRPLQRHPGALLPSAR